MSSKEVVRGIWPRIFMTALANLPLLIVVPKAAAAPPMDKNFYLPDAAASKIVSVAKEGKPEAVETKYRCKACGQIWRWARTRVTVTLGFRCPCPRRCSDDCQASRGP